MDSRLTALALSQTGVFSAAQASRLGVDAAGLHALVRRQEALRLRRGAYVLAEQWATAAPHERYRLRVRALMLTRPRRDAASHHAALALWRLPLWDVDLRTVDVVSDLARCRTKSGVRAHPWATAGAIWVVDGVRTVGPVTAVLQTAAASAVTAAVVAGDAALHRGRCSIEEVLRAAKQWRPGPGAGHVAQLPALLDPLAESPGESRTRLLLISLGFRPQPQQEVRDESGRFVARVDFLVEGVVVEFDGLVKYAGAQGGAELAREKRREDRLRSLGYAVVRLTWADLGDPLRVSRLLREAIARGSAGGPRS